jgi:hypothetical protein
MRVRDWPISILVMLVGSISSLAIAQDIPTGPKLERYTQLWEHNPFAPEAVPTSAPQPSPLDGLFLSSWLREDGRDVIFVQNLQTAEVVKITTVPNQDKLRLIRMSLNQDPRLVEAVISDGNERRAIKFRLDGQALPGTANGGTGEPANARESGSSPVTLPNAQNTQIQDAKANPAPKPGQPYRIYPGIPRVHHEGGPQPPGTVDNSAKQIRSKFAQPNAGHP